MKKILILLLFPFCFFICDKAYASKKVLVVLGSNGFIHRNVNAGFIENIDIRLIQPVKTIVSTTNVNRVISRYQPDVVVAIGDNALRRLQNVEHVFIAYTLCSNLEIIKGKQNFFGISTDFDQGVLLKKIKSILPNIQRLALVYNPEKTKKTLIDATGCLPIISFLKVPVYTSLEFAPSIFKNVKNVDAIVIYPDENLLTQETIEYLSHFTLETQIPVISFQGNNSIGDSTILFSSNAYGNGEYIANMVNDLIENGSSALKHIANSSIITNVNKRNVKMLKLEIGTGFKTRSN